MRSTCITNVNLEDFNFTLQNFLESRRLPDYNLFSFLNRSTPKAIKLEGNTTVGITAIKSI